MLWEALEKNLDEEHQRRIVALLTMTPDEIPDDEDIHEHAG